MRGEGGGEGAEGQKRGIWIPEKDAAVNGTGRAEESLGIRNPGPWRGPGKALNVRVSQRRPRPCLDRPPTLPVGKDTRGFAQCFVSPERTGFSDLFTIFLGTMYVTLKK